VSLLTPTSPLPLQVKLNRGLDCVQLDDLLVDLKLTPDVLEVPVPRYFVEDRAQVCPGCMVTGCRCQSGLEVVCRGLLNGSTGTPTQP
jgi:hypothetical protein